MKTGHWASIAIDLKRQTNIKNKVKNTQYFRAIFYALALIYVALGLFGSLQIFFSYLIWWAYPIAIFNLLCVIVTGVVGIWIFYTTELDPYRKYKVKFPPEFDAFMHDYIG